MIRRIVTYILSFSIAFHPVPLYATNPDVTVLHASKAYTAQSGETPVKCLDVKKGKSDQVHLAFDSSLHQEGSEYLVVLDRNPIAKVFFKQGQLNFWGSEGYDFNLESEAGYC
jgi:hypothetical protein